MAKVLIDIPDETYEYVMQNYKFITQYDIDANEARELVFAVAKGSQIPEGCGRLIDASKLTFHCRSRSVYCKRPPCKDCYYFVIPYRDIVKAPTIIEADKKEDINENN